MGTKKKEEKPFKRIRCAVPELLNEIDDIHHQVRLKIERGIKIRNDEEAMRRIFIEIKDLL